MMWPHVEALAEKAASTSNDYANAQHVWHELNIGNLNLMTISDGDAIRGILGISFHQTPEGLLSHIDLLGGEGMKDWLCGLPQVEAWCAGVGANRISLTGRKGWKRLLDDYETEAIVMTKALNG